MYVLQKAPYFLFMKYLFVFLLLSLVGCSPMDINNDKTSQLVIIDGVSFAVSKRSPFEYRVSHKDYVINNLAVHPNEFSSRKFLFEQAIEKASGCKIKSSLLGVTSGYLTASVQCD